MALAGPAANLLLALIAAAMIRVGVALDYFRPPALTDFTHATESTTEGFCTGVAVLLSIAFTLNLLLATLNMLPLPPLDGSSVIKLFMSRETAARYQDALRNPAFVVIGLLAAMHLISPVFRTVFHHAINLLYIGLGLHYQPRG
jgi:Zn-dependent protease